MMYSMKTGTVNGELICAVYLDGVYFCGWHYLDLPEKYKFLMEK